MSSSKRAQASSRAITRHTHHVALAAVAVASALASALAACSASADTIAYWQFNEGPDGANMTATNGTPNGAIPYTADSSGNGNVLQTYNSPATPAANFDTSPRFTSNVPGAVVPQTGAANPFGLDFTPNQDIYTGGASFGGGSTGTTLGDHRFEQFTVEASVNFKEVGGYWGSVVGRGAAARTATSSRRSRSS